MTGRCVGYIKPPGERYVARKAEALGWVFSLLSLSSPFLGRSFPLCNRLSFGSKRISVLLCWQSCCILSISYGRRRSVLQEGGCSSLKVLFIGYILPSYYIFLKQVSISSLLEHQKKDPPSAPRSSFNLSLSIPVRSGHL